MERWFISKNLPSVTEQEEVIDHNFDNQPLNTKFTLTMDITWPILIFWFFSIITYRKDKFDEAF